ncbi:Rfe UDP-N-acetylmuramyl pentapeptide phosphotransferase/UDP-N- acetylglucosamine-1-phosphate transferase [actinobacterium SCGC AAA044-D11]
MAISDFQFFLLFVSTFVVVGFLTPVMRKIAITNKIYDNPNSAHKTHKEPVPYLGGVAIIIGVVLVSYGVAIADGFTGKNFLLMTSVLAPAIVLGVIGLWDDMRNLRPAPRLAIQTLAGLFTAWILISQNTVGTPTESTILDALITSIWIVGICNSINFFDNLDGGAAGTVAVTSIALFVLGFQGQQFLIAALSAVTAGATIGFLLWNKSPARIYMGDAGALFLGILIATLTIRLHPDTEVMWTSLATPVLLLAIPILDTCVAVLSRIKRGISPLQGGHDHLSHRLVRGGMSRKSAAILLWTLSGFFALCAIAIPRTSQNFEQIIVAIAALVWAVLFIKFFQSKDA